MIGHFRFDDIETTEYAMAVVDSHTRNGTKRSYEAIAIPGRSGALHIDSGRYENVRAVYTCIALSNGKEAFDNLNARLLSKVGYKQLTDTFDPDYVRFGQYVGGAEPELFVTGRQTRFEVEFDCKPQRYLAEGLLPVSGDTLTNPTPFEALPKITVTGSGEITIGNQTITITGNTGTMVIDSEIMDAYDADTLQNLNGKMQTDGI